MGKIAFLFSGQGSQYIGMGKEISEYFKSSSKVYEEASDALGFSMRHMCFEGDSEQLNKTENTQPAILTTSIAILRAIQEFDIKPDVVAGLSLGEYSALVCNGVLDFKDAVKLVKKRGRFMQEAVPIGEGTMAAILGLDREIVLDICNEMKVHGIVDPANFNCPGQIVISGEVSAVEKACEKAKELGARRAIMLKVSGPFHSSMLEPAAINLENEMKDVKFNKPSIPYITNVTGKFVNENDDIKDLLKRQVMSPVYWEDSIKRMIDNGVDIFVEIGPGKTLSSFVKKVDRKKKILNIEDLQTFNKAIKEIKGDI